MDSLPDEFLIKSPNGKPDKFNQKKLKTGIESLRQGEQHPTFPFLVLLCRVNSARGEMWGTLEQYKRKNRTDKPKPPPKVIERTCSHCGKLFSVSLIHGGLRFKKRCSDECDRGAAALRARKRREGKKSDIDVRIDTVWKRSKEQTGLPKGTFKFGDSHPNNSNYVFWGWRENTPKYKKSPEKWVPREAYEKEIKRRARRKAENQKSSQYSQRVQKNKRLQLYTNPKSEDRLVYGTIHPFEPNWIFFGYKRGKEYWLPKDEFDTNHKSSVKYHFEKRKSSPEYVEQQKEYDRLRNLKNPEPTATGNVLKRYPVLKDQISKLTEAQIKEINQIYLQAQRLTKCLKIKFAVDHTVPLSTGGSHEPSNMQVVPNFWNTVKLNHHSQLWPFPFNVKAHDPNFDIEFDFKRIEFFRLAQIKSVLARKKGRTRM
jgi:hypothetical protein